LHVGLKAFDNFAGRDLSFHSCQEFDRWSVSTP
jgi:hypothetical protein